MKNIFSSVIASFFMMISSLPYPCFADTDTPTQTSEISDTPTFAFTQTPAVPTGTRTPTNTPWPLPTAANTETSCLHRDASFNGYGAVVHDNAAGGSGDDSASSLAVDSAGRIIAAGYSMNSTGNKDLAVWRYLADGSPDLSFGGAGFITEDSAAGGAGNDMGNAVCVDASGRIVVAGRSVNSAGNDDMVIWRFNPDGSADTSFNGSGRVVFDNTAAGPSNDCAYGLTITASGDILACGAVWNGPAGYDMALWSYSPSGSANASFGVNGLVTHNNTAGGVNGPETGYAIGSDSSGGIYVTGSGYTPVHYSAMVLWKYTPAGVLDASFNSSGYVTVPGGYNTAGKAVQIRPGGNILVAGTRTSIPNPPMTGFINPALWEFDSSGAASPVSGILLVPDGEGYGLAHKEPGDVNYTTGSVWYNMFISRTHVYSSPPFMIVNESTAEFGSNFYRYACAGSGMAIDQSERLIVAGYASNGNNKDMAIWMYRDDCIDPSSTPTDIETPSVTETVTQSATHTETADATVSFTETPAITATFSVSPTVTCSPVITATASFSCTTVPVVTASCTATATASMTPGPIFSGGEIIIYPNPFQPGRSADGHIKFLNVRQGSTALFYTLAGEYINTGETYGNIIRWNAKNSYGKYVSPGIYYYILRDEKEAIYNKGKIFMAK